MTADLRVAGLAASEKRQLGAALRRWREEAGLTQTELGRLLEPPVSASQISEWETGVNAPGGVRLIQIVRATFRPAERPQTGAEEATIDRLQAELDALRRRLAGQEPAEP